MNPISESVGIRIRNYRQRQGLTQDQLAEKSGLHNTYIGQVERGEKNITLVSLEKILTALGICFRDFFEGMETKDGKTSVASRCYDLISGKSEAEQARLYHILWEIDQLIETAKESRR